MRTARCSLPLSDEGIGAKGGEEAKSEKDSSMEMGAGGSGISFWGVKLFASVRSNVKIAKSGHPARQMFDIDKFDLFDRSETAGMNRIELLRQIRGRSVKTLVIFMTGMPLLIPQLKAVREMFTILTKPFRVEEFYIAVKMPSSG